MKTHAISQWLSRDDCPDSPISWQGNDSITLRTLRHDVMALYLRMAENTATRWALCFEDSYHFCVGLLATLHAGKIPVIPGHCREAQLQEQQSLFDGVLTDLPLTLSCPCWQLFPNEGKIDLPETILPEIAPDAVLVLFTSGSTGVPKQVFKSVSVMDQEAQWLASLWGKILQSCLIRASVSHQHLYGLTFRIWLPMSLSLPFERKMVEFPEQLTNNPRCALISSPAFLQQLDQSLPAPDCSFVVSAGGPLHFSDAEQVMQWLNIIPHEIYGCTETGIMAWRARKTDNTVWTTFSGVSFEKEDEMGIRVYSPLLSDPDGMALDDRLSFDAQGNFTLMGRRDRTVKIGEKRISLSDIERRLREMDGIADTAVLTVKRGKRFHVGAVVVLDDEIYPHYQQQGITRFSRHWRRQLKLWLEPVALPRYWRVVKTIPLNAQSKRSWPALQELFNEAR
ncbi:AMP-binding protein [Xenorhabdus bovienii]|uniref:AMP-binding protein n=1 Tax=Xenorhabdus bovienii TaxID=40576 RepID=UPI0023B25408|nr:AMP-binding protein [Xenorhabdus bovienii]MDE9428955.1 AMP-binding protein [Xenorhabdus bovienii]